MQNFNWIMILAVLVSLVVAAGCSSSSSDDDDSAAADDDTGAGDDTAADDDADDDLDDDTVADDDTGTDDTAVDDDTVMDDDTVAHEVFNFDPFQPCAGSTCEVVAYASVSEVFQVQQFTQGMLGLNDYMVLWAFDGLTAPGAVLDLTISDDDTVADDDTVSDDDTVADDDTAADDDTTDVHVPMKPYVMVLKDAQINLLTGAITSSQSFFSIAGEMHINQIGTGTGDAFQADLSDVEFRSCVINWVSGQVQIDMEGNSGWILSDPVDSVVMSVPQKAALLPDFQLGGWSFE